MVTKTEAATAEQVCLLAHALYNLESETGMALFSRMSVKSRCFTEPALPEVKHVAIEPDPHSPGQTLKYYLPVSFEMVEWRSQTGGASLTVRRHDLEGKLWQVTYTGSASPADTYWRKVTLAVAKFDPAQSVLGRMRWSARCFTADEKRRSGLIGTWTAKLAASGYGPLEAVKELPDEVQQRLSAAYGIEPQEAEVGLRALIKEHAWSVQG